MIFFLGGSSLILRPRFSCSGRLDAIDVADIPLGLLVEAFAMRLCIPHLILKNSPMLLSHFKFYILLDGPMLSF